MGDESSVTSRDGTTIAFKRVGAGPPLILVAAALSDRRDSRKLATLLAPSFTVINYDRRGRGASGDTHPFEVEREVEDIEALVKDVGGSAFLFGSSSGAVLALEAAARGIGVEKWRCSSRPSWSTSGTGGRRRVSPSTSRRWSRPIGAPRRSRIS